MKKLTTTGFLLIFLLLAIPCHASLVQHAASSQGATPLTVTLGSAVTAGDTIVVGIAGDGVDTPPTGCKFAATDNNSNSYSSSTLFNNSTLCVQVFWITAPTLSPNNPPTITCADSAGDNHMWCDVAEFSSLTTNTDGNAGATVTSTTSLSTSSITTTVTDTIFGFFADSGSATMSAGSGWNVIDSSNTNLHFVFEYNTGEAAGTYSATASNTAADATWIGTILALKQTSTVTGCGILCLGAGH